MEFGLTGLTDISAYLWRAEFNETHDGNKSDVQRVISRAWDSGLERIVIVGKNYKSSKQALDISRTHRRLYCTVGCHPTEYHHFKRKGVDYLDHLSGLADYCKKKCVALGLFGLDFTDEGLAMCEKKDQLKFFDWHVQCGHFLRKPLLFYYRGDAFEDLIPKLTQTRDDGLLTGICHSFQGTLAQARELIRKGFYIGFDGCQLIEIVASVRSMELQELADILQMNVKKLFFTKNPKIRCMNKFCECKLMR